MCGPIVLKPSELLVGAQTPLMLSKGLLLLTIKSYYSSMRNTISFRSTFCNIGTHRRFLRTYFRKILVIKWCTLCGHQGSLKAILAAGFQYSLTIYWKKIIFGAPLKPSA